MDILIFCITLHKGRLIPPKRGATGSKPAGGAQTFENRRFSGILIFDCSESLANEHVRIAFLFRSFSAPLANRRAFWALAYGQLCICLPTAASRTFPANTFICNPMTYDLRIFRSSEARSGDALGNSIPCFGLVEAVSCCGRPLFLCCGAYPHEEYERNCRKPFFAVLPCVGLEGFPITAIAFQLISRAGMPLATEYHAGQRILANQPKDRETTCPPLASAPLAADWGRPCSSAPLRRFSFFRTIPALSAISWSYFYYFRLLSEF